MGPTQQTNKRAPPQVTEEDRKNLVATDALLDSMLASGSISRNGPYILTIPQEEHQIYQHRNAFQTAQWTFDTPFARDEWESRQYQTYQYYEPIHSMYQQHVNDYGNSKDSTKSALRTPNGAPRKTMSLSAYKQAKAASNPGTPAVEHGKSLKDPLERVRAQDTEVRTIPQEKDVVVQATQEEQVLKRKREAVLDDGYESGEISSPASKRSRQDDTHNSTQNDTQDDNNPHTQDVDHSLPPRLSPLEEGELSYPERLSPNFPDRIERELAQRKQAALASKKDGKLTPANGVSKHKSPVPKNGFRATDSPQQASEESLVVKLKLPKSTLNSAGKTATTEKRNRDTIQDDPPAKGVARLTKKAALTPRPGPPSPEAIRGTPKLHKDVQSAAMSRAQSNDSRTPADIDSPRVNGHIDKTPSKASKTEEQRRWEEEENRLNPIARSLKHESEEHGKTKPPQTDLAAVKALECLLGYMLVFHCADKANLAAEPRLPPPHAKWTSLRGLFSYVRNTCADTPLLAGITALLGLAFASHVSELFENRNQEKDNLEYSRLARRCAKEVDAQLNVDVLVAEFAGSWKESVRTIVDEQAAPKDLLKGAYQLPVGYATTPSQAARAAHALLKEWLSKSKLDYAMRI